MLFDFVEIKWCYQILCDFVWLHAILRDFVWFLRRYFVIFRVCSTFWDYYWFCIIWRNFVSKFVKTFSDFVILCDLVRFLRDVVTLCAFVHFVWFVWFCWDVLWNSFGCIRYSVIIFYSVGFNPSLLRFRIIELAVILCNLKGFNVKKCDLKYFVFDIWYFVIFCAVFRHFVRLRFHVVHTRHEFVRVCAILGIWGGFGWGLCEFVKFCSILGWFVWFCVYCYKYLCRDCVGILCDFVAFCAI